MAKKDANEAPETAVVKRKSNGRNSPVIGDNGLMVQEGDNAKFLQQSLEIMNLPEIDLHDINAVQKRINEYFSIMAAYDTKPTVAGLGLALNGMDRRRLWEIKTDNLERRGEIARLPQEVRDTIKKAYKIMENLWENYMQNGKINPMAGVFLGVNNYGYQDVKRVDVAPALPNNSENDYDADAIRQRYLTDYQNGSDSNSD